MAATQRCQLVHQLCRLFLGDKAGGLHRIDQNFQLGDGEAAVGDIVAVLLAHPLTHDLIADTVEEGNVLAEGAPLTGKPQLGESCADGVGGEGMLFIRLLLQQFQQPQQLIFLPIFLCHGNCSSQRIFCWPLAA